MKDRYLEVTFRKGKPLAACLYLARDPGMRSYRTESIGSGILVDCGPHDEPIGLEITAPEQATLFDINQTLSRLNLPPISPVEAFPLCAS